MVPRALSPVQPWSPGMGAAPGLVRACRAAPPSEQHIKPQNVSVNIVSHLGEQSMLLSEGERRV